MTTLSTNSKAIMAVNKAPACQCTNVVPSAWQETQYIVDNAENIMILGAGWTEVGTQGIWWFDLFLRTLYKKTVILSVNVPVYVFQKWL